MREHRKSIIGARVSLPLHAATTERYFSDTKRFYDEIHLLFFTIVMLKNTWWSCRYLYRKYFYLVFRLLCNHFFFTLSFVFQYLGYFLFFFWSLLSFVLSPFTFSFLSFIVFPFFYFVFFFSSCFQPLRRAPPTPWIRTWGRRITAPDYFSLQLFFKNFSLAVPGNGPKLKLRN